MTVTADPLDDLADAILAMSPDEAEAFIASLPPDELTLVERAIAHRSAIGWRADPLVMANHLTDGKYKLWKYSRILAAKFRQAVTGESIRQVWMMPARFGKTDLASIYGPTWALDTRPDMNIILTSYGDQLAHVNAGKVRDTIEAHSSQLNVQIRRDHRARGGWRTTEGGQVLAAGVGSSMTGYPGDLIVIDDPFKNWQEAHSEARRKEVWNWYLSVVRLRLEEDNSAIILVGTRWHVDDLAARILQSDGGREWDVTLMSAIAPEPPTGDDIGQRKWWEQLPDPLGRQPGEPIEPERFSLATMKARARDLGSYLAAALEQQRPTSSEGELVKRHWWGWYSSLPSELEINDWLISWDASFGDKKGSSYCVGQVWCLWGSHRFLVDQWRDRMDYPTFKRAVVGLSKRWPQARKILIEDKANGPAVIADLRFTIAGLLPRSPKGSKASRVIAVSPTIESGHVMLPDPQADHGRDVSFVHEFVDEWADFREDESHSHDDQVDSGTQALLEWSPAGETTTSVETRDPYANAQPR